MLDSHFKKEEFKKFLADNDLHYELEWRTNNGLHELMAKFPTGKKAPFVSIASTGTMSYTSFGALRHSTRYLFCLLMNLMLFSTTNQPKILYCD